MPRRCIFGPWGLQVWLCGCMLLHDLLPQTLWIINKIRCNERNQETIPTVQGCTVVPAKITPLKSPAAHRLDPLWIFLVETEEHRWFHKNRTCRNDLVTPADTRFRTTTHHDTTLYPAHVRAKAARVECCHLHVVASTNHRPLPFVYLCDEAPGKKQKLPMLEPSKPTISWDHMSGR